MFSKKNKLLMISLIIGANLYHFVILFLFSFDIISIPRYLAFIRPLYIIIIASFFIGYLYIGLSKLFKKIKVAFLGKKKYSFYLLIFFIVLLIPFTLLINYTTAMPEPVNLYPIFGKYHTTKIDFDFNRILGDITKGQGQTVSIINFLPQNYFMESINRYFILGNYNIQIVNIFFTKPGLEFTDSFFTPLEEYGFLVKDDSFQLEKLKDFDYMIILQNLSLQEIGIKKQRFPWQDSQEMLTYFKYHKQVFYYIQNNSEKFVIFEKFIIDNYNTKVYIYKTND